MRTLLLAIAVTALAGCSISEPVPVAPVAPTVAPTVAAVGPTPTVWTAEDQRKLDAEYRKDRAADEAKWKRQEKEGLENNRRNEDRGRIYSLQQDIKELQTMKSNTPILNRDERDGYDEKIQEKQRQIDDIQTNVK